MAIDLDLSARAFGKNGGLLSSVLAEEKDFDRHTLWRLGSWGAAAVCSVTLAVFANQSSLGWRRDQLATADVSRQAQQIQSLLKEDQNETRRLSSAVDTLNSDRDRLFSRVTVLEQGLESVNGVVSRQNHAAPVQAAVRSSTTTDQPTSQIQPTAPAPAAVVTTGAATTEKPRTDTAAAEQVSLAASTAGQGSSSTSSATPATSLQASKSTTPATDPPSAKTTEPVPPVNTKAAAAAPDWVASVIPAVSDASEAAFANAPVSQSEFAVDVGGANSIAGLRALWRGLVKSNSELAALHPIIMVKESNVGLGLQLRLAAGPLDDAAAAARICAALSESKRSCTTTLFDGQRLAMTAEDPFAQAKKPSSPKQTAAKRPANEEPPKERSSLSALFGRR